MEINKSIQSKHNDKQCVDETDQIGNWLDATISKTDHIISGDMIVSTNIDDAWDSILGVYEKDRNEQKEKEKPNSVKKNQKNQMNQKNNKKPNIIQNTKTESKKKQNTEYDEYDEYYDEDYDKEDYYH